MKTRKLNDNDVEFGAVLIDWVRRTTEFLGMEGNTNMQPREVLKLLRAAERDPDKDALGLIFWFDYNRLACHDADCFEAEVYAAGEEVEYFAGEREDELDDRSWRLLEPQETVVEGDEYLQRGLWQPVSPIQVGERAEDDAPIIRLLNDIEGGEPDPQKRSRGQAEKPVTDMPGNRRFYRTVVEVEILSDEPLDVSPGGMNLEGIHYEITKGQCSGIWKVTANETVDGAAMAKLLEQQGSDPNFFDLFDEGEGESLADGRVAPPDDPDCDRQSQNKKEPLCAPNTSTRSSQDQPLSAS